jgi:xanthine/CO dehydrogenase XdhC/CoxF family maturation factor
MSEVTEQRPGELVLVTRNAIAEAITTIGAVVGLRVLVMGDDDPEGTPRERLARQPLAPHDALVITDHDAPAAYDLLRDALGGDAGYLAMLASRRRTAEVLAMLRDEGHKAAALGRLHLPAGLNVGGQSPGEIALSVVAEVVAWSHGRDGRPMREGPSAPPSVATGDA